jgi:probable F420-dependent oxidoreductase
VHLSVVFPHQDSGVDGAEIREWATNLEACGIDEIEAFDHVLGGSPDHWASGPPAGHDRAPYTTADAFHEPLILFAHLSAVTSRLRFATSILILPQRQTALVAKQCAELDVLSEGRLRVGVGLGWNKVEYDALGSDFSTRAKRIDEQVAVLRALWAEPMITYEGRWHQLDRVGINPLPVARSIPIWLGGMSNGAIGRVVRYGNGWVMNTAAGDPATKQALESLDRALAAAGRERSTLEVSGWIRLHGRTPTEWVRDVEQWREFGIDRIGLMTQGSGPGLDVHLRLVQTFLAEARSALGD